MEVKGSFSIICSKESSMRKPFILLLAVLLLVVAMMPSFTFAQDDELEAWVCPAGYAGQTLHVYNWSTYVADDTIPNFEKLCDVEVIYDVYESNESMFARIQQGNPGYDIVVPTDYIVAIMIEEGLLEELDLDLIPNFANIMPQFSEDRPYDPDNEFSVPYLWGTVGVGYNTEEVDTPITSWSQVFEYNGSVAWLEDHRAMISVGLILLGYDPNTTDSDEIAEARDFLIDNSSNVVAIAADDGQVLLEQGNVDITVEYSGDIFQIIDNCECEDFAYAIPDEGAVVWVDNLAIPKDAPNPELAHVFIDYILDPQVGADIANFTAYGSPNQVSIDAGLIDEEYLSNPAIYPVSITNPDEAASSGAGLYFIRELPDVEQDYLDAWDAIIIAARD